MLLADGWGNLHIIFNSLISSLIKERYLGLPHPSQADTARLILNLSELGVHGGVGSGGEEREGEVEEEGCSAECAGSPVWYSVMISVSHFFLTINR